MLEEKIQRINELYRKSKAEGLNEMSIKDKNDYITMITVKCD